MARAAVTAASIVVVNAAAAAAAILLAREFGRSVDVDGFFAAFAIYVFLVIAAYGSRVVVLPDLTRAAEAGQLARELAAYALALGAVAAPAVAAVVAAAGWIADTLTGSLPDEAAEAAAASLVWLMPAALGQLYAALAASALAARNSYGVAAFAYSTGAVAGLGLFVALLDHGPVALAWGLAANAAVSAAVPLAALALRGDLGRVRLRGLGIARRGSKLVHGAAVPLALQGLYVIAVRFAADFGVGAITTFGYAYVIAAFFVAVTSTSLSLVSSAPLTRRGLGPREAATHVVHTSSLALAVLIPAAAAFALAGEGIAAAVLGDDFAGTAGADLARVIIYLGPWMAVSVVLTLTFPLLFVVGRARALVPAALAMPALELPLAWRLSEALGLPGIALALALATFAGLVVLLAELSPRALVLTARGIDRPAAVLALAALAFAVVAPLRGLSAAALGLVLYAALLASVRPRSLREAWAYVRALH